MSPRRGSSVSEAEPNILWSFVNNLVSSDKDFGMWASWDRIAFEGPQNPRCMSGLQGTELRPANPKPSTAILLGDIKIMA